MQKKKGMARKGRREKGRKRMENRMREERTEERTSAGAREVNRKEKKEFIQKLKKTKSKFAHLLYKVSKT